MAGKWDTVDKGRWTYRFFPNIRKRMETPIWLNHNVVQFLSGQGNFRSKLYQFNLKDTPLCTCLQGNETPEHIIYECTIHSESRQRLEIKVHRAGHIWPCESQIFITTKALYKAFSFFAEEVLERKRTNEE